MKLLTQYWKRLAIITLIVFVSLILSISDVCTITFYYDSNELDGTPATLYYDYGDGYVEHNSSYCTIEGDHVSFVLKDDNNLKSFRFIPIRVLGSCHIVSAELDFMSVKVKTFTEDDLVNLLTEDTLVKLSGSDLIVEKTDINQYDYLGYSQQLFGGKRTKILGGLSIIIKLICLLLLILLPVIVYLIVLSFWKDRQKTTFLPIIEGMVIGIFVAGTWLLRQYLPIWTGLALLCVLFAALGMQREIKCSRYSIYALAGLCIIPFSLNKTEIFTGDGANGIFNFYYILLFMLLDLSILVLLFYQKENCERVSAERSKFRKVFCRLDYGQICGLYLKAVFIYFIYYVLKNKLIEGQWSIAGAVSNCFSEVGIINITWMFLGLLFICLFLGNGVTTLLFGFCSLVILIGNGIKITYHDSLLTPMDLKQIPDMFRIALTILARWQIVLLVAAFVVAFVLCFWGRKQLLLYLKPGIHVAAGAICVVPVILFSMELLADAYASEFNISYKWTVSEYDGEAASGMYLYNMFNLAHAQENAINVPDDYGKEYMTELSQSFEQYSNYTVSDIQPDVICIMAESLFDIENIESLTFSEEVEPTIHQYANSTLISPRFGGYTAAVEYEALTGHSLYFYKDGTMPYTTYYANSVHSVADEFNESGYRTISFHPNTGSFYNREQAYYLMDFDEVYTINDIELASDEVTPGGYCKDTVFAEYVIDIMENSTEPTFVFGVSIAAHYTSADHSENPTIGVSGTDLTEDEIYVLEQEAAAYHDSDEMVRMLIDYVNQCDKPTILYIFGDHLPPLPMWSKLNYLDNIYNKYSTVLIGYSNFKEIEFPEYMTPNYLAPQMLIDAEIEHSSYWDYIYSLRDTIPILHKEFILPDDAEKLAAYENIQYDLMFGKKWILNAGQ